MRMNNVRLAVLVVAVFAMIYLGKHWKEQREQQASGVAVRGLVENVAVQHVPQSGAPITDLLTKARPKPEADEVMVIRRIHSGREDVTILRLDDLRSGKADFLVLGGDDVHIRKKP